METPRLSSLARLTTIGVALSLAACGARTSLRGEAADQLPDAAPLDAPAVDTPLVDTPAATDVFVRPDVPPALDVPIPTDIVGLAAGGSHTCALRSSGVVVCWGSNRAGQLGDGSREPRRPSPVAVTGVTDAVAIAAGEQHSCAVRRDGQVLCWGNGQSGELGDGRRSSRPTPALVRNLTEVVEVAAGRNHTCARRRSGQVWCWGSNGSGELGRFATGGTSLIPVVTSVPNDSLQLAAGLGHTCSRSSSRTGLVLCWGRNFEGQLGNGLTEVLRDPEGSPVFMLNSVEEITAGQAHTCARRSSGEVRCWGSNTNGQLGDGTRTLRAQSTSVRDLTDAAGIAAGANHTCARVAGGQVFCWGSNGVGQFGDGSRTDALVPTRTLNLPDAAEVVAGLSHTCARRTNGQVLCWGNNEEGQLGDGTTERRLVPTPVVGL